MSYTVTIDAMRPASKAEECFYCHSPIGEEHKLNCVLVVKKVPVRVTIEYDIEVPNSWGTSDIEFHRNESSWCCDNLIGELEEIAKDGCLCHCVEFECLNDVGVSFLLER